jgi:hypothetical protein
LFEKFFYEVIDHLGQNVEIQKRNLKRLTRQVFLMDAKVIPLFARCLIGPSSGNTKGQLKSTLY